MATLRSFLAVTALAALPTTGGAGPRDDRIADLFQTVQACKQLQADEVLAPLNIGVKVRGRIAILWGPVPTAELALRAEQRLRQIIELIDVRNELIIMPDDLRDVPVPAGPTPLFLPEKAPPPLPERPRPFVLHGDLGAAWVCASAKR